MAHKLITILFYFFSVVGYSQSVDEKATLLLNDKKVLTGKLTTDPEVLNFKSFFFQNSGNPLTEHYNIADVREIEFGPGKKYERAVIDKCTNCYDVEFFDTASRETNNFGSNFSIRKTYFFSTESDTVFLKVLLEGSVVNLYSCIDEEGNSIYYFRYKNEPLTPLKILTYEDYNQKPTEIYFGPTDYQETFFYKSQLRTLALLANTSGSTFDAISSSLYSESYLVPIFKDLNQGDGKIIFQSKKIRSHALTFFSGITSGRLNFSNIIGNSHLHSIKPKTRFVAGCNAGIEVLQSQTTKSGFLKEILLRFQLTYLFSSFSAVTSSDIHIETNYNFYTQNITPSIQFLIGIYRNNRLSFYIGPSFDRPITLSGRFTPGYHSPAYFPPSFFNRSLANGFKVLAKLNHKWEVDLSVTRLSALENFESDLTIIPKVYQLSFNHAIRL